MDDQTLKKLESSNVTQRRQAVVSLANTGGSEALDILSRVAHTDDDAGVRELAAKAAEHVRKAIWQQAQDASSNAQARTGGSGSASAGASSKGGASTGSSGNAQGEKVKEVSEDKKRIARSRMNSAFRWRVDGNSEKAIADLKRALQIDPSLARDSAAAALAADLMETTGPEAITKLLNYQGSEVTNSADQAIKVTANIAGGFVSFFLEGVFLYILIIIFFILFSDRIGTLVGINGVGTKAIASVTSSAGIVRVLVSATSFIVSTAIVSTVQFFVGMLVGGAGTLLNFIRAMLRANVVCYGVFFGVLLFLLEQSKKDPSFGQFSFLIILGLLVLLLGIQAFFASRAHDFGIFKGVFAVIAGDITTGCIAFLLLRLLVSSTLAR